MSDDELMIYEFMLSMRGVPFSAKEVSKAIDRKRADKDLRWAHTPLKKLVLKERIQQTNEGFYLIPLQVEAEKEEGLTENLVFMPGDVWCGSVLSGLVPLIAGLDIFNLNATETIFLTKAVASPEAKPVSTASPPAEPPPAAAADEIAEAKPRRRTNPFDNIDFFGIPRRPPRP